LNRLTNMVDAVGTSRFSYATNGLLASEDLPAPRLWQAGGPWDADTVSFSYRKQRQRDRSLDRDGA
jgi:hypothetical protein